MDFSDVPQPRHVPGYTGHQPTMQSRVGETFGNISHNIFQNPDLPCARRVSDSSFDFGATSTPRRGAAGRAQPASSTPFATRIDRLNFSDASSTSGCEDRRGSHHLPGYGGHVPTLRNRVGEGYGSSTFTILRDSSAPRARRLSDISPMPVRDLVASQSACHLPGYSGHVPTLRDRVGEGFGNATFHTMRDTSLPQARRLSDIGAPRATDFDDSLGRTPGYAGHVPSLRNRFGNTYGRETNALINDVTVYQGRNMSESNIADVRVQDSLLEPSYMPGYGGHNPQLQERFGETFGRATHELMKDESNPVRRKMSAGRVRVNKQETVITTIQEPGLSETEAPQPHHVPGYTGFTPQLQYRIGETYGRATHELLLDPNVDHARQLVLSDRSANDYQVVTQTTTASRTVETGSTEPISKRPVIPGYDAFVARMRGKRGQRFAINVRQTNMQQDINRRPRNVSGREFMGMDYNMPLQQVTPEFRRRWPALEEPVVTSPKSPYFMEVTNPNKKFITGYTGHLPFRNDHIGLHNASFTNSALYDFTSNYRRRQSTEWAPVNINRPDPPLLTNRFEIYHKNTAMIPNYTGHIPGSKFRSGLTFGNNSRDAGRALRGDRY